MHRLIVLLIIVLLGPGRPALAQHDSLSSGPLTGSRLIPCTEEMDRAWDFPQNPLADSLIMPREVADEVMQGFLLFTDTPRRAASLVGGGMSCNNCHPNGGQREKALPLVGIAAVQPQYSKRSGRLISLEDRVVDCFLRSLNAANAPANREREGGELLPSTSSREVLAISAYLTWLSRDLPVARDIAWRGQNTIAPANLAPVASLAPDRGKELYAEHCVNCHGEDGQGVWIGDKKAGPLWGDSSWNDGAGAARIYTLAGMIRYMMPYLNPGSLTDREALEIAAYINSRERPVYRFKASDYRTDKVPVDAVYYKK